MDRPFYVYVLASGKHGTLYIGMTNDIARRAFEHKTAAVPGFTKKYGVKRLVYFELFPDRNAAHEREVRMKGWKREWKIRLIEENNPDWDDLYPTLNQ
ncbi:MAG: GIY-YIG nuclease family protein [Alphaproteobacteria bacterium]|jgi:putative endonuclease